MFESGRPREPGKPFHKEGGEAPHLLAKFPWLPGPPRLKNLGLPVLIWPPQQCHPRVKFEPELGLNLIQTKPKISGTVPANRHTKIPNDAGPTSARFDDDPKLIAQPR